MKKLSSAYNSDSITFDGENIVIDRRSYPLKTISSIETIRATPPDLFLLRIFALLTVSLGYFTIFFIVQQPIDFLAHYLCLTGFLVFGIILFIKSSPTANILKINDEEILLVYILDRRDILKQVALVVDHEYRLYIPKFLNNIRPYILKQTDWDTIARVSYNDMNAIEMNVRNLLAKH